jgi:uncharacterized protein (UPF0248 family)
VQDLKDTREENKTANDRENSLPHRWLDFTQVFNHSAFGKTLKVNSIAFGSKHIYALCNHSTFGAQIHSATAKANKYKRGETKFPGGDIVIKKLLYLTEAHPDQKYTVCYEDRFLGLVESEIARFYYGSDIPMHRIKFFKVDGTVVWDRKGRFSSIL